MKKAKRLTAVLIILSLALAAAIAVLALMDNKDAPYIGSRFVMGSLVYADIPGTGDNTPPRDGSEPFEGAVRALEEEVRYKGFTARDRLARNAEGGI